ncbi:uncharacterized protein EDB93DRAFT_1104089 [Suillus bovinus]|uniref:uncharacterized protein n=1 Tax=Suillus bovinus TaxID=48563 RepID=UPI001B86D87E|nr:uncharacterized protein EDB93DRAFT_1104089 [Suillus bovinus]KAG2147411.1 hypothetical protein EDB93DRAFT_1104089 [Suillus bovinus]
MDSINFSGLQALIDRKQIKQTPQVLTAANVRQTPSGWVCPNPQSPPDQANSSGSDSCQCRTNPEWMGLSQPAEPFSGLQAFINSKQTKQTPQVLTAANVGQTPSGWVCPNLQSPPGTQFLVAVVMYGPAGVVQLGDKNVQLENQALKERLCIVEEQNKILSANKGRCKKDDVVSEDILAFKAELKEIAVLAELYNMLPQHLHRLVPMNRFSNVFSKAVCAGHASELNKLRSAAGNIVNRSRKTLFGNWQLIAKDITLKRKQITGCAWPNAVKWGVTEVTPGAVAWAIVANIFLLSPDQEFPQEGKGKTSQINYSMVFAFFKELLICNWEKPHLKTIIKHINTFVFERTSRPSHDLNSK